MAERIYNISIAGCSKVAHLHAKAIQSIPNAKLAGVWNRTYQKAKDFAAVYDTKAYSDIPEMVKDNKSDLVIVCTAHPYHKQPAVEVALAGANVLVEKPLASELQECDDIIKTCKEKNVRLGVISQRRWYEPVIRVKQAIEQGKIGRPVLAIVTMLGWRDKAYYDSDEWRGRWKTEGGGVLVCGAIGNILVSNSQKPGLYGKVHVHGENGASAGVQTDGGAMFIAGRTGVAEPPVNDLWTIPGEENLLPQWIIQDTETFNNCDPTVRYMQFQIEDFLNSIRNGTEPAVTGEDGRRTVELFSAIYRSTRDNKPVKFPLKPEPGFDGRN